MSGDRGGRGGLIPGLVMIAVGTAFLLERFAWNLNLNFRRTGFTVGVFSEDRTGRIRTDGTPLGDQSQAGVRARFNWQAGTRTEFAVTGRFVDRETGVANKSRFTGAKLEINYAVGANSTLSVAYEHADQEPRGQSAGGREYVANIVSLFFTYPL